MLNIEKNAPLTPSVNGRRCLLDGILVGGIGFTSNSSFCNYYLYI